MILYDKTLTFIKDNPEKIATVLVSIVLHIVAEKVISNVAPKVALFTVIATKAFFKTLKTTSGESYVKKEK